MLNEVLTPSDVPNRSVDPTIQAAQQDQKSKKPEIVNSAGASPTPTNGPTFTRDSSRDNTHP